MLGQADAACKELEDVGYCCTFTMSNSTLYGVPQDRCRVWFVCIRHEKLAASGTSTATFRDWVNHYFFEFRYRKRRALSDLNTFLLPDTHPLLESELTSIREPSTALYGEQSLARKHRDESSTPCHSNWRLEMLDKFPHYTSLCERQRLILDKARGKYPESSVRVLNISQSGASDSWSMAPTLTPSGISRASICSS